jgi:hypothetical protein
VGGQALGCTTRRLPLVAQPVSGANPTRLLPTSMTVTKPRRNVMPSVDVILRAARGDRDAELAVTAAFASFKVNFLLWRPIHLPRL